MKHFQFFYLKFYAFRYYPKCTLTAEVCGFGHPFCGEICYCAPKKRSLQKNHRIVLYLPEGKGCIIFLTYLLLVLHRFY